MIQHLTDIDLTVNQKKVLARAVAAGAIDRPTHVNLNSEQLTAARDMLDELDIIHYSHSHNTIKIKDSYLELLKNNGIIDDSNQLTDEGQQLTTDKPQMESFKQFYFN
jgi:hypothetical protein